MNNNNNLPAGALTDSEYKGQPGYKEKWEKRITEPNGEWQECYDLAYRYHDNNYELYADYMLTFGYFETRRIYVPIEAPLPTASEQGDELK